ncbi:MAG: peptide deformylase [Candidatus Saccharimonadales bacterium]
MLLKLYQTGHPVLRKTAKVVSPKLLAAKRIQELIDHMINTLRDAPGVGLAAPQVGESLRILIIEDKSKYHDQVPKNVLKAQGRVNVPLRVLINPELSSLSEKSELWFEGCLSIDGYVAAVKRATSVSLKALDRYGKPLSFDAHGWQARILQHEVDHLNGGLFIDKMNTVSFMSLKNFNLYWRKELQSKILTAFDK